MTLETEIYSKKKVPDELIEEILGIAIEKNLSPLLRERIGFLLARYIMGEDREFKEGQLEGEGQTFIKSIMEKPWALSLKFQRGKLTKPEKGPPALGRKTSPEEAQEKRDPSSILVEVYANRPDDWIISANLNLVALPQMALIGKGRIVGREEEGKGWLFKGEDIDELKRGGRYLAIFEFDNSDSEKSIQGSLFEP